MTDTKKVTFGKPKVGGAIFAAPVGTALPKNATDELDVAFKNLGYVSEDGLTNENSMETDKIKAWGGDVVLSVLTGKEDNFSFKLIEALNVEVLKFIYGEDNVEGNVATGVTLRANSKPLENTSLVIEMILQNTIKRIVIPNGTISELGEIAYVDEDAVGYEVTLSALPDENGDTHIEYFKSITENV